MITVLLVTYVVVALGAYLMAERVLFQPPPSSYTARDLPIHHVEVSPEQSLAVLYLPNAEARYTILYSHGNAEDIGHLTPVFQLLHDLGFGVIAYDYRGYGQSTGGKATVRTAVEDAEAVYRFAVDSLRIRPERLIVYGRSVGSGPTLELATRQPVGGVVLESAFTSAYRVLTRVPLLPFDRFPNSRRIPGVSAPVLVIHGTDDRVISLAHGMKLFALAPEPKQAYWVEGAGHNDLLYVAGENYGAALRRFAALLDERNSDMPRDSAAPGRTNASS